MGISPDQATTDRLAVRARWASGYIVAIGAIAAAILIRLLLNLAFGPVAPFFSFVLAVLVAAWYGGLGPGLFATVLGSILGYLLLVDSAPAPLLVTVIFAFIGVTASLLSGELHRVRRRAEGKQRELAQSRAQTQSVLDNVVDGIITIDHTGAILSVNATVEQLFGYGVEELRGQNIQRLIDTSSGQFGYLPTDTLIAFNREVTGRRKDGSTFPVDLAVGAYRVGEQRRYTGVVRDISDRKRVEGMQSGQLRVLEMIARGTPLPDVLGAVCRVIEELEPGLLCSILLTDECGNHTGTGYGPSLPESFLRALEGIRITPPYTGSCCKALDAGEEVLVSDIARDDRWAPIWREVNLQHGLHACRSIPIVGTDGKVLASVAIFRRHAGDPGPANKQLLSIATRLAAIAIEGHRAQQRARRLTEEAATASAQFGAIFNQSGIFAGIMDLDGTLREVNDLALHACGYTREEVVNRPFWETPWWRGSARMQARVRAAWQQAAGGAVFRDQLQYWLADGTERSVDFGMHPIRDASGRVIFLHPTGIDITERLQAEEGLRDANRRKDEFLATLAHELRNPLAPLRNGLQIMRMAAKDSQAVDQARAMMERQLGHMVRLIDDLLDISRINRGKIDLRKEDVELAQVLQQAVETSRPAIEKARHELTVHTPPEQLHLHADVTRLAQVFANLLNNAAKYSEPGGKITITAGRHEGKAVVRVRDTGVGIPAEMLPRVFDIFTQVDRSIEKSQGGLGIGLSLVKGLVELHGGSVEATSDGPGRGSEFIVRLPLITIAKPPAPAPAPGGDLVQVTRRRVLVVDDNRDAATSLAMMLRLLGNETQTAHDGLEALTQAAEFRPDLVMLDLGMPRLNGYDTARRLRTQPGGEAMTLVALTGWGQDDAKRRSVASGFDFHLIKPIELTALHALLTQPKANGDGMA